MGRREEIDLQIAEKRGQIYRYEGIEEELQRKIKKAEDVEWSIRTYHTALSKSVERRTYLNKKMRNLDINNNITSKYGDGLQNYLEGYDYSEASGGLVRLMNIIYGKADDLKSELYQTRQLISDAYYCIERLNWEKATLTDEE